MEKKLIEQFATAFHACIQAAGSEGLSRSDCDAIACGFPEEHYPLGVDPHFSWIPTRTDRALSMLLHAHLITRRVDLRFEAR